MQTTTVHSGGDGYAFVVDDRGLLHQAGFGPAIERHVAALSPELPAGLYPLAHPSWDQEPLRAPALRVTHADGATTTHLRVEHVETVDEPGGSGGAGGEAGSSPGLTIVLVDDGRPLEVRLHFRPEPHGVLRQWVEVVNRQDRPVTLHEVAAAAPLLRDSGAHLTHFGGDWAAEWTPTWEPVTLGTRLLESRGGVRPHLQRSPFFLLAPDGPATEITGTVVAGMLAWGGNVRFGFERSAHPVVRVWCGHNPFAAEYVLDPGEVFTTPEMCWAWSTEGVGPLSRRLHRWARERVVRDGDTVRPIVVNNWEATGFAFDEQRLVDLVDDTSDLGAELFLLDDGWFGDAHPRDDDDAGLGDWTVDPGKLPNGLTPVAERARERGVRFGLWLEPEMVNPGSSCYEHHPDWVVGQPGRPRREERQQLVLDVLQPEVADFVAGVFDRTLEATPGITYVKWDANRAMTDAGSPMLGADRQSNFWVDHARATWDVMATVATRHPDLTLMLCASGGGRVDVGTMRWFHEVWLSDNTDPLDRVRMQWAASHFLPALAVGAHVTRWGGRPVAFGCAVAMSARFGFDLDTRALTPHEREVCRRAVGVYRRVRPLVQHGDLYRLVSPFEGDADRAALAYLAPDRSAAVVFAYQLTARAGAADAGAALDPSHAGGLDALHVDGLDPDRDYAVTEIDLAAGDTDRGVTTGAALAGSGLAWPLTSATTARIWHLRPPT
ncbi:MAG TPA: alpha-galactosidase [Acidimicrobiales bacterium]|jgi:alpha-galactosidase|nr:alpha-galactosidase [Acidimicrobiales bacterium]